MAPYFAENNVTLYHGDAATILQQLPARSVQCCVTSPPYYGLRDYDSDEQIGNEPTGTEYVERLRAVFTQVWRVLHNTGTLWLNLGDSYDKKKNLRGLPWRVAQALQGDGWILRNSIIWHKPDAMPESVTDRLSTKYEHVFLMVKQPRYTFNLDPIREPTLHEPDGQIVGGKKYVGIRRDNGGAYTSVPDGGKNPGDVWSMAKPKFTGNHVAPMPTELATRCVTAGSQTNDIVLDPFSGSGTTGMAAQTLARRYIGIDTNKEYLDLSLKTRFAETPLNLTFPTTNT